MQVICIKNLAPRIMAIIALMAVLFTGTGIANWAHHQLDHADSQRQITQAANHSHSSDQSHKQSQSHDCPTCQLLHSLNGIIDQPRAALPIACMMSMPAAPPQVVDHSFHRTFDARGPPA